MTELQPGPNVYAVIVTHNASQWIEQCLSSLFSSTFSVSIVVVDNCSSDDTVNKVRQFCSVVCIENDKNLGFGRANNLGISYALNNGADYVFLLNQDAYIQKSMFSILLGFAEQHPDFGLISPIHLNGDGTAIDPNFLRYVSDGCPQFLSHMYTASVQESYEMRRKGPNAAAWLLSRDCLMNVGGFDPLFFMYGEDDDLFNRIVYHRFKIGLIPQAQVFHYRQRSSDNKTPSPSIKHSSNRLVAGQIVDLKRLGSFRVQIGKWFGFLITELIVSILILNFGRLSVLLIAFLRVVIRLPAIWFHRQIGLTPGPHWLEIRRDGTIGS